MALKSWVVLCTALVAEGWLFSAIGQLHGLAYKIVTGLIGLTVVVVLRPARARWRLHLGRFQRPLPLAFGLMCVVASLGGILHAPNNYDALSYRMPRLLAWLAAGHWTWLTTTSQRMNYSAPNFEWLSMPFIVLSGSDRLLFLLNLVAYLLLPGLIFSVFRLLGAGQRVAWTWMWVLPSGFCFALQAASIGNDLIGAVFVLASLHFSLTAQRTGNVINVWLALLSAALATGVKGSNLPLLLPALVAVWPVRSLLLRRPWVSAGVVAIALLVSYLPTAILNNHFTGDWKGDPQKIEALQVRSPLAGFVGNTLQLSAQNLQLPFLPGAQAVDRGLASLIPSRMEAFLRRKFPRFALQMKELPQEEESGLGLPLIVLCAACLFRRVFGREGSETKLAARRWETLLVPGAAWLAMMVYVATMGSEAPGRLLAPYYAPLLAPFLVNRASAHRVRTLWWQRTALFAIASTICVLILSPARPLWPAERLLSYLGAQWPESNEIARAEEVYSVYRTRHDALEPLLAILPRDATRIAIVADNNDLDYAFWRPFGVRTVTYLLGTLPWKEETRDFTWVIGKTSLLKARYGSSLEQLQLTFGGQILAKKNIISRVSAGPEEWFVMQMPGS